MVEVFGVVYCFLEIKSCGGVDERRDLIRCEEGCNCFKQGSVVSCDVRVGEED